MSEIKTNKISSLDSSNSDITIEPDGTGDTIIASGNVGIGTSSPPQKFVVSNAGADNIVMCENSSASIQMFMQATSSTGSVGTLTNHPVQFLSNNSERVRIDTIGNLLVNTSTSRTGGDSVSIEGPNSVIWFRADGTGVHSNMIFERDTLGTPVIVGSIQTTGTATSFNTSSDHRLKENVTDMTGAIDRVKALAPKRFNFIADADTTVDGFLAHEAQAVVPESVTGTHNEVDEDGNAVMQGIDQSKLVPLLTGALQEAIAKIEALETSNADLAARVTALENA